MTWTFRPQLRNESMLIVYFVRCYHKQSLVLSGLKESSFHNLCLVKISNGPDAFHICYITLDYINMCNVCIIIADLDDWAIPSCQQSHLLSYWKVNILSIWVPGESTLHSLFGHKEWRSWCSDFWLDEKHTKVSVVARYMDACSR